MRKGKRENRNRYNKDKERGHKVLRELFDTFFHSAKHDSRRKRDENERENYRSDGRSDKIRKIVASRKSRAVAYNVFDEVFGNPAADYRVVRHNQRGNDKRQYSEEFPFFVHRPERIKRVLLRFSSDGDVGRNQNESERKHQHEVNYQEQSAAVFRAKIRKTPDVSHAYRASRRSQNESERTAESAFFPAHQRVSVYGIFPLCFVIVHSGSIIPKTCRFCKRNRARSSEKRKEKVSRVKNA